MVDQRPMDRMIIHMDNFTIHLAPLPRLYPSALPVQSIGYVPAKTTWVHNTFGSSNFSFILKGEGEYRTPQGTWQIQAPCVITQWPDVHLEYGPAARWEELFLIYNRESLPALVENRFVHPGRRHWHIADPGPTRRRLAELREARNHLEAGGTADRIDRICEALVLESLLGRTGGEADPRRRAVRQVLATIEAHYLEDLDFDELALDAGYSPSHLRRLWNAQVGVPPSRYIMRLRIRAACRLLVETDLPVSEIASRLGFHDRLYFSRKFREVTGETATDYRQHRHWALSLAQVE